jgi:hypothetical protein
MRKADADAAAPARPPIKTLFLSDDAASSKYTTPAALSKAIIRTDTGAHTEISRDLDLLATENPLSVLS